MEQRAREQARSNRRLRFALVGTAIGLVLALVAGSIAVRQAGVADSTASTQGLISLVARSLALRGSHRDLAALLALQAYRLRPDALTRGALFATFTGAPGFLGYQSLPVPLTSGQVLRDGQTLLASGRDGVIREIDLATGRALGRFPAPSLEASSAVMSLSADERTVAEISWEGVRQGGGRTTLSVFDGASRTLRAAETMLPLEMRTVAVSPTGTYVAVSGKQDGLVTVYDTTRTSGGGLEGARRVPAVEPVRYNGLRPRAALAFTPGGLLVIGSESGVVRIVDPATGAEVRRMTGASPLTSNELAAVSKDGATLLTTGTRGVAVWDLMSYRSEWSSPTPDDQCASAVLATTIDRVLCGSWRGAALSFDLRNGRQTAPRFDLQGGNVSAVAVTPNGHELVELGDGRPVMGRWNLDGTGPVTALLPVQARVGEYSPDGKLLLGYPSPTSLRPDQDGAPEVIDARSGRVVNQLTGYAAAFWAASPTTLLAWNSLDQGYQIEVLTKRRLTFFDGSFGTVPTQPFVATSRGRLLAWNGGGDEHSWRVWDVRTGQTLATGDSRDWAGGSLTADGRILVAARAEGLTTYEITSGGAVSVNRLGGVRNAKVSPAGTVAASTSEGTIAFYDVATLGEPASRSRASAM